MRESKGKSNWAFCEHPAAFWEIEFKNSVQRFRMVEADASSSQTERRGGASMIQPMSLNVILGDFSRDDKAWTLQGKSGRYLVIPDERFPGRRPIRFFKSKYDACRVLEALLKSRPALLDQKLIAIEVRLLDALQGDESKSSRAHADSFVVNSLDEVFELICQIKAKTAN